jgi:integrase
MYRLGKYRGKYAVIWRENGERFRRSLRTDDLARAQIQFSRFLKFADEDRRLSGPAKMTGDIMKLYYDAKPKVIPRPSLIFFSNLIPALIDKKKIDEYIKSRASVKAWTIRSELQILQGGLNWAVKERFISEAPKIHLPPPGAPRERWLTAEEAHKIIASAGSPHIRLFIFLGLFTGARSEAILTLPWSRVTDTYIDFNDLTRLQTKKRRAIVPIAEPLAKELKLAKKAALTDYVIEYNEKPVKSIKKAVARAVERAGLSGISAHTFRHTAATWCAKHGVPLEEISTMLGHTARSTTARVYIKHHQDYLAKAIAALTAEFKSFKHINSKSRGSIAPTKVLKTDSKGGKSSKLMRVSRRKQPVLSRKQP